MPGVSIEEQLAEYRARKQQSRKLATEQQQQHGGKAATSGEAGSEVKVSIVMTVLNRVWDPVSFLWGKLAESLKQSLLPDHLTHRTKRDDQLQQQADEVCSTVYFACITATLRK